MRRITGNPAGAAKPDESDRATDPPPLPLSRGLKLVIAYDLVRRRLRYFPFHFSVLLRHVERLGVDRLARRVALKSPDFARELLELGGGPPSLDTPR